MVPEESRFTAFETQVRESRLWRVKNVGLVLLAVSVGFLVPEGGAYADDVVVPLVLFLVYTSIRSVDLRAVAAGAYWRWVGVALVLSYGVFPFVGIGLARQFLSGDALLGLAIILAAPTTAGSAIIWTRFSDGNEELAAVVALSSLLVTPLLTPLILSNLLAKQVGFPAEAVLFDLLVIVVGSLLLRVLLADRWVTDSIADRGAELGVLCLVYASVASVRGTAVPFRILVMTGVLSCVLLVGPYLVVRYCCRRLAIAEADMRTLHFSSTLKNLGIALVIALPGASPVVLGTIITYYVTQQVGSALLADVT